MNTPALDPATRELSVALKLASASLRSGSEPADLAAKVVSSNKPLLPVKEGGGLATSLLKAGLHSLGDGYETTPPTHHVAQLATDVLHTVGFERDPSIENAALLLADIALRSGRQVRHAALGTLAGISQVPNARGRGADALLTRSALLSGLRHAIMPDVVRVAQTAYAASNGRRLGHAEAPSPGHCPGADLRSALERFDTIVAAAEHLYQHFAPRPRSTRFVADVAAPWVLRTDADWYVKSDMMLLRVFQRTPLCSPEYSPQSEALLSRLCQKGLDPTRVWAALDPEQENALVVYFVLGQI